MCNLVTTVNENLNWYEALHAKGVLQGDETSNWKILKDSYEIIQITSTDPLYSSTFTIVKVSLLAKILRYFCCDLTPNTKENKKNIQRLTEATVALFLAPSFDIKVAYSSDDSELSNPQQEQLLQEACANLTYVLAALKKLMGDLSKSHENTPLIQKKHIRIPRCFEQDIVTAFTDGEFKIGLLSINVNKCLNI